MRKDDTIRLRHMLDAAHEALGFAQGRSRPDLDRDRMLVLSLVKEIEIHRRSGAIRFPASRAINCRPFPSKISSACVTAWFMPTLTSTSMSSGEPCRRISRR